MTQEKQKIKKLKDTNELRSLQFGDVVESTKGILAFEKRSFHGNNYFFVSHRGESVVGSYNGMSLDAEGNLWFREDSVKVLYLRTHGIAGKEKITPFYQRRIELSKIASQWYEKQLRSVA